MNYFTKCVLIISFFCACGLHAQNNDLYIVKLKSGLQIKCELVKVIPDSFVTVRQYGLISNIPYGEVVSIHFSESAVKVQPGRQKTKVFKKNLPDSGWSIGVQPGFSMGMADDDWLTSSFQFRLSALKSLSKKWQAGVTVGLDPYAYYGIVLGTVLAEGRYYLEKDKPRSAFFYGLGGYGFNLTSARLGKDGGINLSYGFGKAFRNKNQNIFSYMFGYRLQKAQEDKLVWAPIGSVNRTYHYVMRRFEFKVEWRF